VVLVLRRNPLEDGWEIGVIEDIMHGPDGQVRSALVRTTKGVVRRAALDLVALPKEEEDEGPHPP